MAGCAYRVAWGGKKTHVPQIERLVQLANFFGFGKLAGRTLVMAKESRPPRAKKWIPQKTYVNLLSKANLAEQLQQDQQLLSASYEKLQHAKSMNVQLKQQLVESEQHSTRLRESLEHGNVQILEQLGVLFEENMLLPLDQDVDTEQVMQRAVSSSMGIGPHAHDACVVLQSRVERAQNNGVEMGRQIQELERQMEENMVKQAELQTLLTEERMKNNHLQSDLGETLGKMNEVIHTRDQGIAAAEECCVSVEEALAKAQLRNMDLEASHLDLNDQLIGREEEVFMLRKFLTVQAETYNNFVQAELKKRLGYVPIKVEQFVFDEIPRGVGDTLDELQIRPR
jgi:hypothetical protein